MWWAAILFFVGGSFEAVAVIKNLDEPRGALIAAVTFAFITVLCLRIALARVEASPAGILVINIVIRYRVAWQEIERFEIVRRATGVVCKVVRTDGSHSFISAVGERLWEPDGEGAQQAAELNRELARQTGRPDGALFFRPSPGRTGDPW